MTVKEVIEKYCSDCQYNDRCLNPCYVVIDELQKIPQENLNQFSLFTEYSI